MPAYAPIQYQSLAGAGLYVDRIAVDLPSVTNGQTITHDVALPAGSAVGGDTNIVLEARHVPDLAHGLSIVQAYIAAADTLRLVLANVSAGAINPAAGTLRVAILKTSP